MKTFKLLTLMLTALFWAGTQVNAQTKSYETDSFETPQGQLNLTFIGHGTLMIEAGKMVIHIDPVSREADYAALPKADLILVTHEHGDHLDPKAVALASKSDTRILASPSCSGKIEKAEILANGATQTFGNLTVTAVPAYNIVNKRGDGVPFHPKGNGNGYVIAFGGKKVYVAGDTENIPEMTQLKAIDIAFLPMNLPYTMTPQMAADAARSFMPKILYPYHMGETNSQLLVDLLKGSGIEVRIRKLK